MKRWKAISSRGIGVTMLGILTIAILVCLHIRTAEPPERRPIMGIVATATEDQRKDAQAASLMQAAEMYGFDVLSMPVERTLDAQIEAIRALIVYRVDIIVFVPLVEDGWENVMREADAAEIPLLAVDKSVQDAMWKQRKHYVGYDYCALAQRATEMLLQKEMPAEGVIELYGTLNSYDAREIARGSREELERQGRKIQYSFCGDGMRSRGYEIAESLHEHLDEIGYIICHNDAMALGALDYLKENGYIPGEDICICSFGGGADAREALDAGDLQVLVQLNDWELAKRVSQTATEMIQTPQRSFVWLEQGTVLTEGQGT